MKYTVLMLFTFQPAWLRLSRAKRGEFNRGVLEPIWGRYPDVSCRHFDAEAFSGYCSDFALFETPSLERYYQIIEELRDTPLFSLPYLSVQNYIIGLEDGFKSFESSRQVSSF